MKDFEFTGQRHITLRIDFKYMPGGCLFVKHPEQLLPLPAGTAAGTGEDHQAVAGCFSQHMVIVELVEIWERGHTGKYNACIQHVWNEPG